MQDHWWKTHFTNKQNFMRWSLNLLKNCVSKLEEKKVTQVNILNIDTVILIRIEWEGYLSWLQPCVSTLDLLCQDEGLNGPQWKFFAHSSIHELTMPSPALIHLWGGHSQVNTVRFKTRAITNNESLNMSICNISHSTFI